MIKESKSVSMSEASEYTKKTDETDMPAFIKKFTAVTSKQAKEFRKELEEVSSMKINEKHISKVIDLLPEDNEALNKIFTDVNLNEDETKKVIDAVKKYK